MGSRPASTMLSCTERLRSRCWPALLRRDDIDALVEAVAPADIPGWFTPDVAVLELATSALDLASVPGSEPLQYEGPRERYLPEVEVCGRVEHGNSHYALYAACVRSGP